MPRGKGTYGSKVGRPKKKKAAKKKAPAKAATRVKPVRKAMGGMSKAGRTKRSMTARKRRGG